MNIDQALGQVRPITALFGIALIVAGVLKYFGVDVPLRGSGAEAAVIGLCLKHI